MVTEAEVASGAVRKGLLKVIFTNPPVLISLLVIITGFVIYIGMSAQQQASQITSQYSSLDAKPENSKEGFDKKLFYITVDENGNTVVHVGFESEEQEIAAQQAAEEAGTTLTEAEQHNYDGNANGIQDMCNLLAGAQADLGITDFAAPSQFTEKEKAILIAAKSVGLSDAACCGIIGNSNAEGGYGLQQYGKTSSLGTSSNSSPLYIYNYDYSDVLSAFVGLNHTGNTVGIGMTQWTSYTYFDASRVGSYAWYLTSKQDYWNTDKKACIMYIELKLMQQSAAGIEAHASDSTTLPSFGNNHATWTWDQLYTGCGAATAEEKKAARAAAWYLWTHERPSNYTTLEKAVGRATNAVNALRRM